MRSGLIILLLACTLLPAVSAPEEQGADLIVSAHYASWYGSNGSGWTVPFGTGSVHTFYHPLLGEYDCAQPAIFSQHINWALAYGINTFMIEWCGTGEGEFPATLEPTVRTFRQSPDFSRIRFYFVYSFATAFRRAGEETFAPVDFNDPKIVAKLVADMRYAAANYLRLPNALTLRGRPVIYFWAQRIATGDLKGALKKMRAALQAEFGIDIYIISDELNWGALCEIGRVELYDGVMSYAMVHLDGTPPRSYDQADAIDDIIGQYSYWKNACADLGRGFVPNVNPGYNVTGAPWCYDDQGRFAVPLIRRSPKSFKRFVSEARRMVDPNLNMLAVTSWSEWNEGTNIEPSTEFGFDYLTALKAGLTRKIKPGKPLSVVTFRFPAARNPDGPDERRLADAYDWIEFIDGAGSVLQRLDIGKAASRASMGIGWSADEVWEAGDYPDFVWAGDSKKRATLHLALPAGTSRMRLRVLQFRSQKTTVFIDDAAVGSYQTEYPMAWEVIEMPFSL